MTQMHLAVLAGATLLVTGAQAESLLFESALLGPTGITSDLLRSGQVASSTVDEGFVGHRFELTGEVITSRIGGHFAARNAAGDFFGALITLDGPDDLPDSAMLDTEDVLGVTTLTFPETSGVVFGDLSLRLEPGWYALAFGGALFDSTAFGAAVRNSSSIGPSGGLRWDPNILGNGWGSNLVTPELYLVVAGSLVPEPSTEWLALAAWAVLFPKR